MGQMPIFVSVEIPVANLNKKELMLMGEVDFKPHIIELSTLFLICIEL